MIRLRFNKVLMEIGLAIALFIIFIGILNTITISNKNELVNSSYLYNNCYIRFEICETSDPKKPGKFLVYKIKDIATLYEDYIYIQIPGEGYVRGIAIYWLPEPKYFIEHGINEIEIHLEPINSSELHFGEFSAGGLSLKVHDGRYSGFIWWRNKDLVVFTQETKDNNEKYNVAFGKFRANVTVSEILAKSLGVTDKKTGIFVWLGDVKTDTLDGIKLKVNIYAYETKPVLQVLTEPVYGFIAGLWSSLLALYYRLRQYVLSFFGGFTGVTIFTGLIGDVIVGLIITIIVITIFYIALGRPSPRRR